MFEKDYINKYTKERQKYQKLGLQVESIIKQLLIDNSIEFHYVSNRTKSVESFTKKMKSGKYKDPINDITDLTGIRIITYVESEIPKIGKIIKNNFIIDEFNSLDKGALLRKNELGYKSIHYIVSLDLSKDTISKYKKYEGIKFEIQIRTILQHAWAEIEHDRNYKFSGKLPEEIQRNLYLLSGLLELADKEFNRISMEIDNYSSKVEEKTKKGDLDIPINSTSLKSYLIEKFKSLIIKDFINVIFPDSNKIINEITKFGIKNLKELDEIIPINFIDLYERFGKKNGNFSVIIRIILIVNNYKKYFLLSYNGDWMHINKNNEQILQYYNIDIKEIKAYLKK